MQMLYLGILLVIVLVIVSIILYYVFFNKKYYHKILLKGPELLTLEYHKIVNFDKMKPSKDGIEYTYLFWIYTFNMSESGYWHSEFDTPKPIFTHYKSPDVFYLPDKNTIRISIGFKNNTNNLTSYDFDIKNFKYQAWQQVGVVINNSVASIFLNGQLYTAAQLPNVPWIANRMLHIGNPKNNFNGYLYKLEYFNIALSSDDIIKNYKKTKWPALNNSFVHAFKQQQLKK
jgi:hypothetical protein